MVKEKQVIFRMDEEGHAAFKAKCKEAKISMSAQMLKLISEWKPAPIQATTPTIPTPMQS